MKNPLSLKRKLCSIKLGHRQRKLVQAKATQAKTTQMLKENEK